MRTASRGGRCPSRRKRRTLLYDARSTSMENVDSGLSLAFRKGFSSKRPYSSVLKVVDSTTASGATIPPGTPPTTPPATPCILACSLASAIGGGASLRATVDVCLGGDCGSSATLCRASLSLLHETSASETNSTAERMRTTL